MEIVDRFKFITPNGENDTRTIGLIGRRTLP